MLGVNMKYIHSALISAVLFTFMTTITMSPAMAIGKDDPRWFNEHKLFSVRCQVHKFGAGNAVVGYVVGNDKKEPEEAERVANRFVSKFGAHGRVAKRHCRTQKQYIPNGAYDQDMNPI